MNLRLPPDLVPHKRTASFTETTVPAALLGNHSTKRGVWGLIEVESGKLRYFVTDPRRANSEQILVAQGEAGVVEPTILHRVEPVGAVRFHVRFLREAAREPVQATRREQGKQT